jgi:hypothetical protein
MCFYSSPKRLEWPQPELVHWWLLVHSSGKALPGFFHFLEIVTGRLVPSAGQKIPVQPGWYLPPQKIRLCFFRQVRELKIQRKNPGSTLGNESGFYFASLQLFCLQILAPIMSHASGINSIPLLFIYICSFLVAASHWTTLDLISVQMDKISN